jgi:hypothetical protein
MRLAVVATATTTISNGMYLLLDLIIILFVINIWWDWLDYQRLIILVPDSWSSASSSTWF